MKIYSVRDLKELPGAIISDAQKGHLSVVTKHGNPVFVAVPMTDLVLDFGVHVALAVHLYQEHVVSIGKAAKMAKMSLEAFIAFLAKLKIPVTDYSVDELRAEIEAF